MKKKSKNKKNKYSKLTFAVLIYVKNIPIQIKYNKILSIKVCRKHDNVVIYFQKTMLFIQDFSSGELNFSVDFIFMQ